MERLVLMEAVIEISLLLHERIITLLNRMHKNKVIVALANKLVRVVWAILARDQKYQAQTI